MTENSDWLYEYLKKFLQSPGWRNPILEFIDLHCGQFDDLDENKFFYTELHTVIVIQKFKDLIDDLLHGVCLTLGVSSEQFIKACDKGRKHPKDRRFFQQIFACDNFSSFKKLMLSRNKELEQESKDFKHIEKKNSLNLEKKVNEEEEKKRREQGFAVKLSKEVFKGFMKDLKKTKKEQKKKENSWKVEKKPKIPEEHKENPSFIQSLTQQIECIESNENDKIDLKSKLVKSQKKHSQDSEKPTKNAENLEKLFKLKQDASIEPDNESLEQKRISLQEEEIRLTIEKLRLIEEAKRIEKEKQELEKIQKEKMNKKLQKKQNSVDNLILSKLDSLAKPEIEFKDRVLEENNEVLSFCEPVQQKFLSEEKVEVNRLEARFLSFLTVPECGQK